MNRNIFLKNYETQENTKLVCPECHDGKLLINKENISLVGYDKQNKESQEHEAFEPEWLKYGFHGFFECNNCNEKIVFAGKSSIDHRYINKDEDIEYYEELVIEYIERPPYIIEINDKIPEEIKQMLIDSFKLFWIDISSCANKIRIILELMMDLFKVQKYVKTKRTLLNLHNRLEIFSRNHPSLEPSIFKAIKWIGNYASHNERINKEDVLDSYALLEYALKEIYNDKEKEILKIAKSINKTKKPRSKKSLYPKKIHK